MKPLFKHNPDGTVTLDDTPVAIDSGLALPDRVAELRRIFQQELALAIARNEVESPEEADDLNVDEDEPMTIHELRALEGIEAEYRAFLDANNEARKLNSPAPQEPVNAPPRPEGKEVPDAQPE